MLAIPNNSSSTTPATTDHTLRGGVCQLLGNGFRKDLIMEEHFVECWYHEALRGPLHISQGRERVPRVLLDHVKRHPFDDPPATQLLQTLFVNPIDGSAGQVWNKLFDVDPIEKGLVLLQGM